MVENQVTTDSTDKLHTGDWATNYRRQLVDLQGNSTIFENPRHLFHGTA